MAEKELTIEDYKAILEWQGLGEIKTVEDAKTTFNKKFFTEDQILKSESVKKKIGMLVGSINTELKNELKALGVELASNEIEEDDGNGGKVIAPKKIVNVGLSKLQQLNNKIQDDLKGQIGASTDEKIKSWETKFNKINTDYEALGKINLDYKTKLEEKEKEVDGIKKSASAEVNSFIRKDLEEKEWGGFSWADETEQDSFAREGFRSYIDKKAKFELSDTKVNDQFVLEVRRKDNGERFEDPTKKGQWLSPSDFLKMEGLEANKKSPIMKINTGTGKKTGEGNGWYVPEKKEGAPKTKRPMAIGLGGELPATN